MTDSRTIAASPEEVWNAILDPEVLKQCVPGCTEMSGNADDGFEATVVQKVGPVKATFKGTVVLSDMVPGKSLTLTGEGKGGAAGFAKGGADVKLAAVEGGTELQYDVDAKVGGKLAQLGSRIIDGFAKKMADQFFSNFQSAVEGPQDADAEDGDNAETGEKKKGWLKKLVS
jgi:carbon monoxide dehydrogenase subunit G